MSRSEVRCPNCGQQIGWKRKGQLPNVFRPVNTDTIVTALGVERHYTCPDCRHRWRWTAERSTP